MCSNLRNIFYLMLLLRILSYIYSFRLFFALFILNIAVFYFLVLFIEIYFKLLNLFPAI